MNAYVKWTLIGLGCIWGCFAGGVNASHGEPLAMIGAQTLTADDFLAEMARRPENFAFLRVYQTSCFNNRNILKL